MASQEARREIKCPDFLAYFLYIGVLTFEGYRKNKNEELSFGVIYPMYSIKGLIDFIMEG